MKDSEVFQAAQWHIKYGGETFICHALRRSSTDVAQVKRLQRWVMHCLGHFQSYRAWMIHYYPTLASSMTPSDFQKARLRWVDWFIAECQKEEVTP